MELEGSVAPATLGERMRGSRKNVILKHPEVIAIWLLHQFLRLVSTAGASMEDLEELDW